MSTKRTRAFVKDIYLYASLWGYPYSKSYNPLSHPDRGDFMFSVRFRRVRRRKNFSLSRQNRFS